MCCYFLFADFIESDVSTRSLTWLDFSFAQKTQFRIVIFKSFDTNIEYCKLCCQQHPSRLKLFEIHRIVKTFKSQNKIRLLSSLPPSLLVVIRKCLPLFCVEDNDRDFQRYPRILFYLVESDVIC